MTIIKARWTKGQIIPECNAVDWPEGCELMIEPVGSLSEKIGLDESEWRDDEQALADWETWLTQIEPLELTNEEIAAMDQFARQMRAFNLEAVRRDMNLDQPS